MNPITVYFVIPRIHRTGGYERQAITLAQTLRHRGVTLHILTDCQPTEPLEDCRVLPAQSTLGAHLAFRREFAAARAKGPAIVHIHGLYRFSAVGLWTATRLRLPTLLKLPSSTDVQILFQSRRLAVRVFQPMLQRVDRFLCPSQDVARQLEPHLRRPEAATYLPNGVDTQRFSPATAEQRRHQRDTLKIPFGHVMLNVGRHVALKGGDVLLRAFARSRRSLPADTGLVFLGDGEETATWKRLATDLGIATAVMFAPTHTEPERYFQAADAFVLPSLREGLPNALLEAMACGLPCAASDTGGIRDVLAGKFPGQLVPPGDVDALAAALPNLLEAGLALGTRMREDVQTHFSIDTISQQLIGIYDELIRTKG
ncbi:MAG TPA: glycosyltransferase family 4 protein [Verrucomicrobiae bacterium]|nr:glycosyltransferase family 4 protein [Verrucomicrobiae bacterium]